MCYFYVRCEYLTNVNCNMESVSWIDIKFWSFLIVSVLFSYCFSTLGYSCLQLASTLILCHIKCWTSLQLFLFVILDCLGHSSHFSFYSFFESLFFRVYFGSLIGLRLLIFFIPLWPVIVMMLIFTYPTAHYELGDDYVDPKFMLNINMTCFWECSKWILCLENTACGDLYL